MPTLFYSPAIRVLIECESADGHFQTIDVSDDLSNAKVNLNENAPHHFSATIMNHRRKYDGLFTPNDRIVVQLRRVNWLQIFAGYLSEVPFLTAFQRSVTLTAECTLKRLRYFPFDPGSTAYINLVNSFTGGLNYETGMTTLPDGSEVKDGGMSDRVMAVMTKVVGWPAEAIHIGGIPDAWTDKIDELYKEMVPLFDAAKNILGGSHVGSGTDSQGNAAGADPAAPTTPEGAPTPVAPGAGTEAPPATSNPSDWQAGPDPLGKGGLIPAHVMAAYKFIKSNWADGTKAGVYISSMYRPGGGASAHGGGLAIDISVPGFGDNQNLPPEAHKVINSIVQWFMKNPKAFGLSQVIWQRKYSNGGNWIPITDLGSFGNYHINHLHLNFAGAGPKSLGPMGDPWPNSELTDIDPAQPESIGGPGTGPSTGGGGTTTEAGPAFVNASSWLAQADPTADTLTGPRLLINDTPEILPTIAEFCRLSHRSYASAPNGDFIAWWPDYFGLYGTAARLVVKPIEVKDFTITWTDERLKTHQFVIGADLSFAEDGAAVEYEKNKELTHGIASVEFPPILEALMGIKQDDPIWGSPEKIFKRFGARPETRPFGETNMFTGQRAAFWAALWYFQRGWAEQFSADIPLTFMPELFPGMLIEFEELALQFYVTNVTHNIDFSDNAGFTTTASVIAPSSTFIDPVTGKGRGFRGLVVGKSDPATRLKIQPVALGAPVEGKVGVSPNLPPAYLPQPAPSGPGD
jgi:hypothetical protein